MSSVIISTLRFLAFSWLFFVIFGYIEVFHLRLYESDATPIALFVLYIAGGPLVLALPTLSYFVTSAHSQSHFGSRPRGLFSEALSSLVYVAVLVFAMVYQENILAMGRSTALLVACFLTAGLPGGLGMANQVKESTA